MLMQQGKLDEAAKQLDQLKKIAANTRRPPYFEAQLAYQKKDFKRAAGPVATAAAAGPQQPARPAAGRCGGTAAGCRATGRDLPVEGGPAGAGARRWRGAC